jgi:hypothetical protein
MVTAVKVCAAVAGEPVDHSLTPDLFRIVADRLRKAGCEVTIELAEKVETGTLVNALAWGHAQKQTLAKEDDGSDPGRREVWLSLTYPLKHQMPPDSGTEWVVGEPMLACANQMRHDGHVWRVAATDGLGLVLLAKEFGFEFQQKDPREQPLLCMNGGGSTARSCAAAWVEAGGLIWWRGGQRALSRRGPWRSALVEGLELAEHIGRKLHADFDVEPGTSSEPTGDRIPLQDPSEAPILLSVSYDRNGGESTIETEWGLHLDGRWLLVAQHLEAWRHLFMPQSADNLPSVRELMSAIEGLGD